MNEWEDFLSGNTADRSDLQLIASCPRSFRLRKEHMQSVGELAVVGVETHEAIAKTIADYIGAAGDKTHWMNPSEIADTLRKHLNHTRPDVQPEVIDSMRASIWAFAQWLHPIAPWHIMRHDGGEGDLSGQLSEDVETSLGIVRATCELDFLAATQWKEVVIVRDWKTGWGLWAEGDIWKSFQFQMQAWLVFAVYPDVQTVLIGIWNTRTNRPTYDVEFGRDQFDQLAARVHEACEVWMKYHTVPANDAPAWPSREKCEQCDAAAYCNACDGDIVATRKDPQQWLHILQAERAKVAKLEELLESHVLLTGRDIVCEDGTCFGFNKPVSRKPSAGLYVARK